MTRDERAKQDDVPVSGDVLTPGAFTGPSVRVLDTLKNVTPGAEPSQSVGRSLKCIHGFEPCWFADTASHYHRPGGTVISPACAGCHSLTGPFDRTTGLCPKCAGAAPLRRIGPG